MLSSTTMRSPATREQTATLVGQTMSLVAITAGLFAVGAYLGRNLSYQLGWLWFVAALGALFAINRAVRRSDSLAVGLLFGFGTLLGLSAAPTIRFYAGADPQVLWLAGSATGLFIAAFGSAGYAARRDLSTMARSFFWALVALIVFGIVLIFVQIPHGQVIYGILGLVIFAGLTMFDFQRLRRTKDIRTAPLLAASIFLDIANVFFLLLSLFTGGRD